MIERREEKNRKKKEEREKQQAVHGGGWLGLKREKKKKKTLTLHRMCRAFHSPSLHGGPKIGPRPHPHIKPTLLTGP